MQADCLPNGVCKVRGAILVISAFSALRNHATSAGQPPGGLTSGPGAQGSAASASTTAASSPDSAIGSAASHQSASQQQTGDSSLASCSPLDSLASRSASFVAVVSEHCAKVYQIPAASCQASPVDKPADDSCADKALEAINKFLATNCVCTVPLTSASASQAPASHHAAQLQAQAMCKAALVRMRASDETCLVACSASGLLQVRSLPHLRPLLENGRLLAAPNSVRLSRDSLQLASNGHCLYATCESELCKSTISANYKTAVSEMLGSLFVARDMPEMPRANFFKSLFSSVAATSSIGVGSRDRDELFGHEAVVGHQGERTQTSSGGGSGSGLGSTTSAGSTREALERMRANASTSAGQEVRFARDGLNERGEKLSEIEDRTLMLQNQADSYAQASHQLLQKFKDKKWYQF